MEDVEGAEELLDQLPTVLRDQEIQEAMQEVHLSLKVLMVALDSMVL
jgi:hypothetical protein